MRRRCYVRFHCPICRVLLTWHGEHYQKAIRNGHTLTCQKCKPILAWMRRNVTRWGPEGVVQAWTDQAQRWANEERPDLKGMEGAFAFARWLAAEATRVVLAKPETVL